MKNKFSQILRGDGTISRTPYVVSGLLLFCLKYNVDRLVATVAFGKRWTLFDYLQHDPSWTNADLRFFYMCMVGLALPFIWSGVVLTLRRLRSAGLPLGMVALFFVPVINLVLFAVLSVLPSKHEAQPENKTPAGRLDKLIPESKWGSAALAIAVAAMVAVIGTAFSASFLRKYGAGLFVGLPFSLGLLSVLIYGYHRPRTLRESIGVSLIAVALAGAVLLIVAMEGIICLIMAAPLALVLSMFGAVVAHTILRATCWRYEANKLFCTVLLTIPSIMGLERITSGPAPLLSVKTSLDIASPPETVWNNVVAFTELPPPKEWIFRLGIAYPIHAQILGRGAGAVRRCNFSTGPFVEPIEVWDEPRLLRFSVTSNPAPMQEWTPYRYIHPPHLDGFLASEHGQFFLTRSADGGTRLEGTTWYRHNMWPAAYWQVWSDFIIHTIHLRVLKHIKAVSEEDKR